MYLDKTRFRFVNTVLNSRLGKKVIWKHIQTLRFQFLKSISGIILVPYIKCKNMKFENSKLKEQISLNNEKLSEIVKEVNSSQEINHNISKNDVKVCAEMFVALNSCPTYREKLYLTAIYGSKAQTIAMVAAKIIKKANINFRKGALKIFANLISVLGFKHIGYKSKGNKSSGNNIELVHNIMDIKGKSQLPYSNII